MCFVIFLFFFSSRRRHTRSKRDWSSDVCSSDLKDLLQARRHHSRYRARMLKQIFVEADEARPLVPNERGIHGEHQDRSEERRVGKECRSRWWPNHCKEKDNRAHKDLQSK